MEENTFVVPDEYDKPVVEYKDYLNLNMEIFHDSEFYSLKVYAKKLLLALIVKAVNDRARRNKDGAISRTYAKIFHVPANLYHVYAEKLHVTVRMIKSYFKDIEKWVSMYNDREFTQAEIITVQEKALKKPEISVREKGKTVTKKKIDRFDSDLNFVKMLCRRKDIESDSESLTDAAMLVSQYQNRAKEIGQGIRNIVEKAVSSIGSVLSAAGLNKYISSYVANAKSKFQQKAYDNADNANHHTNKSQFHNFPQRTYDKEKLDELERMLLCRS